MRTTLSQATLLSVSKPGRYVNGEWNSVHKEWDPSGVSFALAFPDVYEIGMSNLGIQIIYDTLNRREDTCCERVFAPWIDMEARMRANRIPLFSLESRRPVAEFDVVGFSVQHELAYTNLLNMLDLSGIPLDSHERGDHHPLICVGGPSAYVPEPLASFVDFFVIGDGEEVVHQVVDAVRDWKRCGRRKGRWEFLRELSAIEGVYVPSLYTEVWEGNKYRGVLPKDASVPPKVSRRIVADLEEVDYPRTPVVPLVEAVHDRATVEVFRGCTRGCRFCQAGVVYRPVRELSPQTIVERAERAVRSTGSSEVSLASLSTCDYTEIRWVLKELVRRLAPLGVNISLPSLRADAFSIELAKAVQSVRRTGLTFAPEAGTQRLRMVINKTLSEEDIDEAIGAARSAGWKSVKLYFMVGLPTETEEDVRGIVRMVRSIRGRNKGLNLSVTISPFSPKAHTPFQWEPQLPLEELERRYGLIRDGLNMKGVTVSGHGLTQSLIESVFSRGDRRVGRAVRDAWEAGCRFDSWTDRFDFDLWLRSFARNGIDPRGYANRRIALDEVLPWDHIETGVSKSFLAEEYHRAMEGIPTFDCRVSGCAGCGVCNSCGIGLRLAERSGPPNGFYDMEVQTQTE